MNMAFRTVAGVNVDRRRGRRKPRSDDSEGMFGRRQRASLDKEQAPEFGQHTDVPDLSWRVHASLSNISECLWPGAAPTENRLCLNVGT